jgi:hypothetical protein
VHERRCASSSFAFGWRRGSRGHLRASSAASAHQAIGFELSVGASDRVGRTSEVAGELADRRKEGPIGEIATVGDELSIDSNAPRQVIRRPPAGVDDRCVSERSRTLASAAGGAVRRLGTPWV